MEEVKAKLKIETKDFEKSFKKIDDKATIGLLLIKHVGKIRDKLRKDPMYDYYDDLDLLRIKIMGVFYNE